MSEEKVLTLRGKKAVWAPAPAGTGPIDPKRLPEGYPYKEGSKTVIEWDGNSEGRPSFGSEVSGACKVSDEVFYNLAGCPITFIAGDEVVELTLSEGVKATDNVYSYGDGINQTSVLVVLGENAQNLETGTYFFKGSMSGMIMYVSKLTVSTETIHPMAPEFLPAGVGVPTVTADDNGKFLRVVDGKWAAVALESAEGGSF